MKALIVDDERLARAELKRLLSLHSEIEVAGEARNASEARQLIEELSPELLFLDIHMPGQDGFELLESLDEVPSVIFTTAYDQHAIEAFEVNALDYLLKPLEEDRLSAAIQKALSQQPSGREKQPRLTSDSRFFVKDGARCWFVRVDQVRLFESEGNYTRIYFEGNRPLINRSLRYLEERLDPEGFFRASRKHLVGLRWIESIQPLAEGGLHLHLKGGKLIRMSRRQSRLFRQVMQI